MDSSAVSCANWAGLPEHLLDMVVEKLVLFSDYARFSSVCVRWHSVASFNRKKFAKKLDRQFPMFLFPKKGDEKGDLKSLYNVATNKLLKTEVRVPFSTRFGGSSRGWLITVGEDFVVTLINPISPGSDIKLPPILKDKTDHFIQIQKAILSADPITKPNDYVVAAIYGELSQLAVIKPGTQDAEWTYIDSIEAVFDDIINTKFADIIYYEGRLHAVDYWGEVFCFNDKLISSPRGPSPENIYWGKNYLVESSKGDLLLVYRHFKFFYPTPFRDTRYLIVYKWIPSEPIWVEVKSLGEECLFLGDSMSTSMLASDFPGCCPNSIYFTHDFDDELRAGARGPIDSGVFNLEDSYISPHHVADEASRIAMTEQFPIWFVPNFSNAESFPNSTFIDEFQNVL